MAVEAADLEGGRIQRRSTEYFVRLQFGNGDAAAVVLGQADFSGSATPTTNVASSLRDPARSAAFANGRLFVSDTAGNRVLAFDENAPSGADAVFALGTNEDLAAWFPATVSLDRHPQPRKISSSGDRMAVTDTFANRVVIYDGIPLNGTHLPRYAVGQSSFAARLDGCSDIRLRQPGGACITDDGKLILADTGNNRVLIWRSIPTTFDVPADVVLGQRYMDTGFFNNTGGADSTSAHQTSLYSPTDVWSDGRRLVVADFDNHRVLIWNEFPTENMQAADVVLGQPDFASNLQNQGGIGAGGDPAGMLNFPRSVACNGHQLAIADEANHRVLLWNSFPQRNGQQADIVLGHAGFDAAAANDGRAVDDDNLDAPTGVLFANDKLVVTDTGNSRVLIFQSA